jgi:hypothetical protein
MNEIIKRIQDFQEVLRYVKDNDIAPPRRIRIYLDNARTNELLSISGNYIYGLDSNDLSTDKIYIRINKTGNETLTLEKGLGYITIFNTLFITNSAVAGGYLDILVGSLAPDLLQVVDNRSQVDIATDLSALKNKTVGGSSGSVVNEVSPTVATKFLSANASRKTAYLCANPNNTGLIYVGFDNAVANNKYLMALSPGQIEPIRDHLGEIWVIDSGTGEKVGGGETV